MAKNKSTLDSANNSDNAQEPTRRERIFIWLTKAQFVIYTALVIILLALGFLWPRMFITVPAGHHAVLYRQLQGGTVTDRVWGEGLHLIAPWDEMTVYETRLQETSLGFDVLSEEGLDIGVKVSVRYRPQISMLGYLHRDIGIEYFARLVTPEIQSHVRRTFGSRPVSEIYTSARDVLQELGRVPTLGRLEIVLDAPSTLPYIQIQELKLLDVELPGIIQAAIADKFRQEQLMLEYRYRLAREEQEAERKRTEAAGIRDFNLIASKITPAVLQWRGIEASLELAKSQNAKVVVLGGGQGGMPMIMNLGDSTAPAAPPPSDTAPAPAAPGGAAARAPRVAAPPGAAVPGGAPAPPAP